MIGTDPEIDTDTKTRCDTDAQKRTQERRLAFVALTRARNLLMLSWREAISRAQAGLPGCATGKSKGVDVPATRSRFLCDIPSSLYVTVNAAGLSMMSDNISPARVLVVLTRAAAASRAVSLLRSRRGSGVCVYALVCCLRPHLNLRMHTCVHITMNIVMVPT